MDSNAEEVASMEIHWTRFPKLRDATRMRIESRLQKLSEGHHDLIDVRIIAALDDPHDRGVGEVKIVCLARGQQLLAAREHEDLGRALNCAIDDLEHEIHRLRERRRTLRRQPRAVPPEAEAHPGISWSPELIQSHPQRASSHH
jgi:ribosome-associated translation inhibitor RaiA